MDIREYLDKNNTKRRKLYPNRLFKRMIDSVYRVVYAFANAQSPYCPVIDGATIFVSPLEQVVFTKFEKRTPDWALERLKLSAFFNEMVHCETVGVKEEFARFATWVENSVPGGDVNDIYENLIFWTEETRIAYIICLHDHLEHEQINPIYNGAFHNKSYANCNWRQVLSLTKDPIINYFLSNNADYFDKRTKANMSPSWLRDSVLKPGIEDQVKQGLTFIRDCFLHMTGLLSRQAHISMPWNTPKEKTIVTCASLHRIFRYTFPSHMIAFWEGRAACNFSAKLSVLKQLSDCRISFRNPNY